MGVEENKRVVTELFARFDAGDVAGALDLLRDGKITRVREYMDTKHVEVTWSQAT
jgi:ketosteroid isomerase-like protein